MAGQSGINLTSVFFYFPIKPIFQINDQIIKSRIPYNLIHMKKSNIVTKLRTNGNPLVIVFTLLVLLILISHPILGKKSVAIAQSTNIRLPNATINPPSIPTGKYNIQSNGLHGSLNITSLDSGGKINGTIDLYPWGGPASQITGYFDEISGKITFVRVVGIQPSDIEVYTGYKFGNTIADCIDGTGPGSCFDLATFAGTFKSFSPSNKTGLESPNAKRNTFGWYASHIPQPCPACPG